MEIFTKYIYLFIITPLSLILLVYLYYLYRDPKRGENIENRANIIFDDKPLEERHKN